MSDRARTLTVVLDDSIRIDDDLTPTILAIKQIKGVISVASNISDPTEHMAIQTAKHELRRKIWKALEE